MTISVRVGVVLFLFFFGFLAACQPQALDSLEDIPLTRNISDVPEGTVILAGQVYDAETGEGLDTAVLSTLPETTIIRTDRNGNFVLEEALEEGRRYRVIVEAAGYESAQVTADATTARNEFLDIGLVDTNRLLPLVFVPNTAVLTADEHQVQISTVNQEGEPIEWRVARTPEWITASVDSDELSPDILGIITVALNPEVFEALAGERSQHHGTIEIRDNRERLAALPVVAIPGASSSVQLAVHLEETTLELESFTTASVVVSFDGSPLRGAAVGLQVSGEVGGLEAPTFVATNAAGEGTFMIEALRAGEYDLTFRLPAFPGVRQTTGLTVLPGEPLVLPEIENLQGPASITDQQEATFTFQCSLPNCTFRCSLESADQGVVEPQSTCASGVTYSGLADDEYTFRVTALDSEDNQGPEVTFQWEVSSVPTVIDFVGPEVLGNDPNPGFSFGCSKADCAFDCSLSGPSAQLPRSCANGTVSYSGLSDGTYTFTVNVEDSSGLSGNPFVFQFTIDTVAPTLVWFVDPSSPVRSEPLPFDFECTDKSCTYSCVLSFEGQAGTAFDCDPPLDVPLEEEGSYLFSVTGTDEAGNEATITSSFVFEPPRWVEISAGEEHGCAISDEDRLYCWGNGANGRLGQNNLDSKLTPSRVGLVPSWSKISAGGSHTCGIESTGRLRCWGNSQTGRLGIGGQDRLTPVAVGIDSDWVEIMASAAHTCGIRATPAQRDLYCWGQGDRGQTGLGSAGVTTAPTLVTSEVSSWESISSSGSHTCGISTGGDLYCWGNHEDGRLGIGQGSVDIFAPKQVTDIPAGIDASIEFATVSAGDAHTCAITVQGHLLCWGKNSDGRLGLNTTITAERTPRQVGTATDWVAVEATTSTCALNSSGATYCWGSNQFGQLASSGPDQSTPEPTDFSQSLTDLRLGKDFGLGLTSEGRLLSWGVNSAGQLGLGLNPAPRGTPEFIDFDGAIHTMSSGEDYGCLIDEARRLYCWGEGANYKLGLGDNRSRSRPVQVGTFTDWDVISTSSGSAADPGGTIHTCGLRTSGRLYCWGTGTNGVLGVGDTQPRMTPTEVLPGSLWKEVSTGLRHTCAIRNDDTLWCWGNRTAVGSNFGADSLTPRQIGTSTWKSIAGGANNTCGVQTGGTLWCWSGAQAVPTQVSTMPAGTLDDDWMVVVQGASHRCALKEDQTLYCWGSNGDGQLGRGDLIMVFNPHPVGTFSDWVSISAGFATTCGIRTGGNAYCWGRGTEGQLGQPFTSATTPRIFAGSDWTEVHPGRSFVVGFRGPESRAYSWGSNRGGDATGPVTGQRGDHSAFRNSPDFLSRPTP